MAETDLTPGDGGQGRLERLVENRLRPTLSVMHDATFGLFRHDGVMVASAIAFSLTFAVFPFAIFLVALGALFGGHDLAEFVSHEALTVLPHNVVALIEPELNRIFMAANRAQPLTFGIMVTLISITGAVEAIRDGLNRAYGCAEDRHLIRRYVSSLAFVIGGMAFVLTAAALGIIVPLAVQMIDRYVPGPQFQLQWLETTREGLLVVVTLAMLFSLHLFLPAKRRRFSSVVGGVLVTLIGWWVSGKLFGFYIAKIANYTATYAGLAGFVILMFFLYIQALIFLYGAEVNRSIADMRRAAAGRT